MKPVVVIDDDMDVRDVIVFALENEGIEVIPFENGKEGLEALISMKEEEYPCLIIVDYLMPVMNGAEFIKEIRANHQETIGKIPIAFSSAMGTYDPIIKEAGEIIQLHKPMDLDDLLTLVKKYCF